MEIDSMALREIIRAAEIIEEAKSSSISSELLANWKDLVAELGSDGFSALYHAMEQKVYAAGELVVEQGTLRSSLYFVNTGQVQLLTVTDGREKPFRHVTSAEIFGVDTFFDISVWTISAKSMGADISMLTWENLKRLKKEYPSLRSKLEKYCHQFKSPQTYFKRAATSRRRHERINVAGDAQVTLLDKDGKASGQGARGELLNISRGGVAFVLHFSKKKNAVPLLGRKVRVAMHPKGVVKPFVRNGQVKALGCHDFVGNAYSLHIEFDTELPDAEVLQAAARQG
jgi:hypothetical protein